MKDLDSVSITTFNDGDVTRSLMDTIDLVGGLNPSDAPILIKPNLCVEVDESGGANTSIQVIRGVINGILREEKSAVVRIIESDGSGKYVERAFENSGYFQLEEEYHAHNYNVSLVNLSKEPTITLPLDGLYFKRLKLPKILLQKKYFISIAKAKTHGITQITGVLKNQFGCFPEKNKTTYHRRINQVIVDLNKVIQPDLCIVDGLVGMEGVERGKLRKMGIFICGHNPASTDATLARVMGFNPKKIEHIVLATKHGLGSINPEVIGERVESVTVKFRRPSRIVNLASKYIPKSLYPTASSIYNAILSPSE